MVFIEQVAKLVVICGPFKLRVWKGLYWVFKLLPFSSGRNKKKKIKKLTLLSRYLMKHMGSNNYLF